MTKFYLESRANKLGLYPVRVCVTAKGVRFVSQAGISVNEKYFDRENGRAKKNYTDCQGGTAASVNAALSNLSAYFDTITATAEREGKQLSSMDLKKALNSYKGKDTASRKEDSSEFFAALDTYITETAKDKLWTFRTADNYTALRSALFMFSPGLTFENFDERKLKQFVSYLRSRNLNESTVNKRFKCLKTFLQWASKNGYSVQSSALDFEAKFKITTNPVIYLSWEELLKVHELNFDAVEIDVFEIVKRDGSRALTTTADRNILETARDIFLFECFTGLRVSDIKALKRTDVRGNCLFVTTIKTGSKVKIELNKYSSSILDKYLSSTSTETIFPNIPESTLVKYIKQIGHLAGIDEPIAQTTYRNGRRMDTTKPKYSYFGTHTGRRSFVCNALSKGIAPQIVMQWTGHANYNSLKPYIAITDTAKVEAMALFDK